MKKDTKKRNIIIGATVAGVILTILVLVFIVKRKWTVTDSREPKGGGRSSGGSKGGEDAKLKVPLDKGKLKEVAGELKDIAIGKLPVVNVNPEPQEGFNPLSPTTVPVPGKAYAVKSGDSDSLICAKAGFSNVHAARMKFRDHALNAWIPKTTLYGPEQLNLRREWAPMAGYEDRSYAYKTAQKVPSKKYKWPVVYVPRIDEVPA